MNHIERVNCAIKHRKVDKVPRGDFWLDYVLIKKILKKNEVTFAEEVGLYKNLGFDLRVIFAESNSYIPSNLKSYKLLDAGEANWYLLEKWREYSDIFLMAGVNGIFQTMSYAMGFKCFMREIKKNFYNLEKIADRFETVLYSQIDMAIKNGANGILIADDVACNMGLLVSIDIIEKLCFSIYRRIILHIKEKYDIPFFFHSDGNITHLFDVIVGAGFDGVHSLEKEAGVDILDIKKQYGDRLCLMGNIGMEYLISDNTASLEQELKELSKISGRDGGFILSSSAGILGKDVTENALVYMAKAVAFI